MYAANAATNVRNQRRIDYTQPAPQPLHATSAVTTYAAIAATTVRNQRRNHCTQPAPQPVPQPLYAASVL